MFRIRQRFPLTLKSLLNLQNPVHFQSCSFTSSPVLHGYHRKDDEYQDFDSLYKDPDAPPRLFVVQPRFRSDLVLKAKLDEALNLANSLEQPRDGFYKTEFSDKRPLPYVVVQNPALRSPRAGTYFGEGTVQDVKCHLDAVESKDEVDGIFVNAILSGIQHRNLERAWGKPVLDRVGLIIQIFNAHAQTKEAKLQAALASMMYKKSRLVRERHSKGRDKFGGVEEMEVVSARGRGSGGRGFISGAGETELELQQRRIRDRKMQLKSEINRVRKTRALQRAARKREGCLDGKESATVAVVGYTNAGKSTLVSALSDSYLYCDDRLFATVDPKLRSVLLPSGRKVLLSDTVGFISDLPVQLVEAFCATLEEVVEADLLVHVLDSSAQNLDEHRKSVLHVLREMGVSEEKFQNMIEVWNKIDLQEDKVDEGELGSENYISSCSGEEDSDATSYLVSKKDVNDKDDHEDISAKLSGDHSDRWLSSGDERDSWVDYDGCSVGSKTVSGQQNFSWDWRTFRAAAKVSQHQPQFSGHVKTSAITGVGLQELLELIDQKLEPAVEISEGDTIAYRKWRPPVSEDNKIAV